MPRKLSSHPKLNKIFQTTIISIKTHNSSSLLFLIYIGFEILSCLLRCFPIFFKSTMLLVLYCSVVRPCMEYASHIWVVRLTQSILKRWNRRLLLLTLLRLLTLSPISLFPVGLLYHSRFTVTVTKDTFFPYCLIAYILHWGKLAQISTHSYSGTHSLLLFSSLFLNWTLSDALYRSYWPWIKRYVVWTHKLSWIPYGLLTFLTKGCICRKVSRSFLVNGWLPCTCAGLKSILSVWWNSKYPSLVGSAIGKKKITELYWFRIIERHV